jgi:hypothetical protein
MQEWRVLNAIVDLRKQAADVVTICDLIVYSEKDKAAALRLLPDRIRTLRFRANRCLTALEEGQ